MRKTLLVTIQSALGELGQAQPQVVVSSMDNKVQQMKALLAALCDELCYEMDWQELLTSYTFTTVPGQTAYKLPSDCLRIIDETLWDQTSRMPVYGPRTDQSWNALKNGMAAQPVFPEYRLQGDSIVFISTPLSARTISFDYISSKYVIAPGNASMKFDFTDDSDNYVFDDRLVINGLKLKYLEVMGMDTTTALSDYNRALEAVKGSNRSARRVSLAGSGHFRLIDVNNLPDGNWGQ